MDLDTAIYTVSQKPAAYVLRAASGAFYYKGACRDLAKRLKDHRSGRVRHTKNKRPLTLVHFEYVESYSEALKREKFFKSGAGRDYLRNCIK